MANFYLQKLTGAKNANGDCVKLGVEYYVGYT